MRKPLHFYEETYGENIYILNGASGEEVTKFVRRQFKDSSYNNPQSFTGRCVNSPENHGTVIALREAFHPSPRDLGTLAHECVHAADYILWQRGLRHSKATSEAFAYLVGSLLRRCLRELAKKRN